MKQPTEQEWQEILEWCGFEIIEQETRFEHQVLYRLSERDTWKPLGSLPIDLNNLFKYAVPEGEVQVIFHEVHWADGTILTSCELRKDFAQMGMATVEGKIKDVAALAFFWAVKQVMDSEKKVALER